MGQKDNIMELLALLNRDRYPLATLKCKPLPDGVGKPIIMTDFFSLLHFELIEKSEFFKDPTKLEFYLSDEEFRVNLFLNDFEC